MKAQAKELRIGNYHKSSSLEIPRMGISSIKIDGQAFAAITGYGIYLVQDGKIDFEPIGLTEEWLLKFGFTYKKASGYGGQDQWSGMGFITNGKINFRGHPKHLTLEGYFNTQIQFVHQLQNLYFALTGEELELSPPQS